jgi:hypothetical protein
VTTANILEGIAVARRSADDAAVIFGAYATTRGLQMAQAHTAAPETPAPAAGMSAPGLGGGGTGTGGSAAPGAPAAPATANPNVVAEHEIFRNEKNALAFFFYHTPLLDKNAEEGPFWFTIQGNKIIAGTSKAYAMFEDIKPEVLAMAKQRGVIMLVEFENQQPYRCTPCYLSDSF